MKVICAEYAGPCYGVERALKLAHKMATEGQHAYTLGPLIHNPLVVEDLKQKGVYPVPGLAEFEEILAGEADGQCVSSKENAVNQSEANWAASGKLATDQPEATDQNTQKPPVLIIRSHGVTPEVRDALYALPATVCDATCPHVARAQQAALALGKRCKSVVVVGEAGHPEVLSLVAYASLNGAQVCTATNTEELPQTLQAPVGVLVQTTQRQAVFEAILQELRIRGFDLQAENTICSATSKRQSAARSLAGQVDAMVVVGGKNSSNTTRLAEICAALCSRTYHIESLQEIDGIDWQGVECVGVTAGASTPSEQIDEVIKYLQAIE